MPSDRGGQHQLQTISRGCNSKAKLQKYFQASAPSILRLILLLLDLNLSDFLAQVPNNVVPASERGRQGARQAKRGADRGPIGAPTYPTFIQVSSSCMSIEFTTVELNVLYS